MRELSASAIITRTSHTGLHGALKEALGKLSRLGRRVGWWGWSQARARDGDGEGDLEREENLVSSQSMHLEGF
jgi:hypothetical protein